MDIATPHQYIEDAGKSLQNKLEIKEPPCKGCKFFTPRALTNAKGEFSGVSLCSAEKMYRDFTCFEEPKRK